MTKKLYVFLRSDLESMTPGKAAAQVAHAASQHILYYINDDDVKYYVNDDDVKDLYNWSEDRNFGTTIVLDGESLEHEDYKNIKPNSEFSPIGNIQANMVTDTSYPLRDGKVYHSLSINTCFWIFVDPEHLNELELSWLKSFKLYNGNHD